MIILLLLAFLKNASITANFYDILNVTVDSSSEEIKKSYRKLVIQFHPDKLSLNLSEEEKANSTDIFVKIQEAYETLVDPLRRLKYNYLLNGINYADDDAINDDYTSKTFASVITTPKCKIHFKFSPLPDIISELKVTAVLPLEYSFMNTMQHNQTYHYKRKCLMCNGTGGYNGETQSCTTCSGSGLSKNIYRNGNFHQATESICKDCHGKGYRIIKKCMYCGGVGLALVEGWTIIPIPKGAPQGQEFLYPGMGHENKAGDRGDLVISLHYLYPQHYSLLFKYDLGFVSYLDLKSFRHGIHFNYTSLSNETIEINIPSGSDKIVIFDDYKVVIKGMGLYKGIVTAATAADTPVETQVVEDMNSICDVNNVDSTNCINSQIAAEKKNDKISDEYNNQQRHKLLNEITHISNITAYNAEYNSIHSQNNGSDSSIRGDLVISFRVNWTSTHNDAIDLWLKSSSSLLSQDDEIYQRFQNILDDPQHRSKANEHDIEFS